MFFGTAEASRKAYTTGRIRSCPSLSKSMCWPRRSEHHTGLRVPHGQTMRIQNFRQLPNDRLGAGSCLRSIHYAFPDRPNDGERVAGEIRPFMPTEFPFAESGERRGSDSCFLVAGRLK